MTPRLAWAIIWAIFATALHGCANPYLTAYRTTATARATAETTRDALHDVCHLKRVGCLETHGAGTPAYDACWAECRKAEMAWVDYVRPAINSGLLAALGAIQIAEATKVKPDVMAILKPIACALAAGLRQWGHLLPPSIKAQAETIAGLVAGATCPKVQP